MTLASGSRSLAALSSACCCPPAWFCRAYEPHSASHCIAPRSPVLRMAVGAGLACFAVHSRGGESLVAALAARVVRAWVGVRKRKTREPRGCPGFLLSVE